MTPVVTANVTLQDASETAKGGSSGPTSVANAAGDIGAAAQQAFMPFSTGPRR